MIAVAVIHDREICRSLQLATDKNLDSGGRGAVLAYSYSSSNVFNTGLPGHASRLATLDITHRVLVIVANGGGRQGTTRSEDRSGIGVSPVARRGEQRAVAG